MAEDCSPWWMPRPREEREVLRARVRQELDAFAWDLMARMTEADTDRAADFPLDIDVANR